ncbi:MAG: cytochrome c oxidase accessory protein CcoG [Methylophilaceae bacterium]
MSKDPVVNATDKVTEQAIPLDLVKMSLYKSEGKIYPRNVTGLFTNWRWVMVWLTQLFFYGIPWINWGSRQALLFELESQRFYIFNFVFYPQDLIYLALILIISALALFLFTAVAGRLWCGFTCPQTVYTEIFLWIEAKIEGDRPARMRLDESPMTAKKFFIKFKKHFVWIVFSLFTGFTFVGYFTPIRELASSFISLNLGPWETFWVVFYGFATYGNAGFMREQVCKYMCPYARFQSAMFDDDTLIVTYDNIRGEPRGGRSRKAVLAESKLGACVDCSLCVQVCPTGIDIRQGLQYECIQCGACADVCDTVMDKMGYEPGLIKFSTQNAMTNRWTDSQVLQHIKRPRVLIYTGVLTLLIVGLLASLWVKPSYRVNVVRDGVMARMTSDGKIENVYRMQIMNATENTQHYELKVNGLKDVEIEASAQEGAGQQKTFEVKPTESRWVVVDLKIPDGSMDSGSHKIQFEVLATESNEVVTEKSVFLVTQ